MGNEAQGMMDRAELEVHLAFDPEAGVWYVAETDIPGLSLEAATPFELLRRIVECAPELLELNAGQAEPSLHRPTIAVRPVFDTPFELRS